LRNPQKTAKTKMQWEYKEGDVSLSVA